MVFLSSRLLAGDFEKGLLTRLPQFPLPNYVENRELYCFVRDGRHAKRDNEAPIIQFP